MAISLYSFIFVVTLAVFSEAAPSGVYENDINANAGEGCGTVIASGLNDDQINEILAAHAANNQGSLKWSKEFAAAAQTMVNKCTSKGGIHIDWSGTSRMTHTEDSNRDVSFTKIVNSMLAPPPPMLTPPAMPTWTMPTWTMPTWTMPTWTMPKIVTPAMPVFHWNSPDFSISNNNFPSRRYRDLTGDYTNMVGCGFLETQKGNNFSKYFVCLYGPSGNSDS